MSDVCILYVEDNPENRLLVKRVLEAEGYSVLEATDGPSGLEMVTQARPDLILLDINLPEVDGYDLARRFRDTPGLQQIPILAVTANVMKGDRERTLAAGCDGYIPKPIDIDRLPEQIRAALQIAREREYTENGHNLSFWETFFLEYNPAFYKTIPPTRGDLGFWIK